MASSETMPFPHVSQATLPTELVDMLNQVYFLHQLATEPEKVIPPGKTLLSMLIHSQMHLEQMKQKKDQDLLETVKEVAHRAFWAEAVESLSSPLPSVQLPRLRRLYHDLAEALAPLFPPDHKVIQSLKAHIPPTSSPLHSALSFLKNLLLSLRERCAPVRDEAIDQLYAKVDEWRDPLPQGTSNCETESEPSCSPLATLVVDSVRELVSLAEYMKSDLNTAVIGSMGEEEVKGFVLQQAKVREREVILELWNATQQPVGQVLREKWRSWITHIPNSMEIAFGLMAPEKKWIARLMAQLATNSPISCNLPPSLFHSGPQVDDVSSNQLPPHFFFVAPKLLYIQNCIQAITIAASLRSLTRLPVVYPPNAEPAGRDFMERIWSLLKTEIDEDADGTSSGIGSTKIINLSDEVVRARRLVSSPQEMGTGEESRLRDAVDRTLRPQDPVFQLLQRRLIDGLTRNVLETLDANKQVPRSGGGIPEFLKTGRTIGENRAGKRARIALPVQLGTLTFSNHSEGATAPAVKGFEDPTLGKAIRSVFREILAGVSWVEMVWGDLM